MQLAIVQNPHTKDPTALWNELDKISNPNHGIRDEEMDREGLIRLKELMSGSRNFAVK